VESRRTRVRKRFKKRMKSEIEVFREYIRRHGLRNTPEREVIIEEIFSTHDHFDVDELHLRLRAKGKRISKPSIYRLIPLLLEAELIQEAYFEDGHLHYEHIYGHRHHCHLRCLGCGKTVEFEEESIHMLESILGEQYGFTIRGHKLEVFGYCSKCRDEA
jgi:Fur family transcriptional regulator, ferric uptake regulator